MNMGLGLNGLLHNMVVALVLGLTVWIVQRWIRNPAVRHVLWVLVLLKLVTPPLWNPELKWLPPVELSGKGAVASVPAKGETKVVTTPPVPPGPTTPVPLSPIALLSDESAAETNAALSDAPASSRRPEMLVEVGTIPGESEIAPSLTKQSQAWWPPVTVAQLLTVALAIWIAGSIAWFLIALVRILRFQHCLRHACAAETSVQQGTQTLAMQLGLRHTPRVWLVPGKISPMLWAFGRAARLIVPSELFAELDDEARDALLLHELAHYRRGDHFVRYLELAVLRIWWWNPVVWLVRRELRITEEQACDAWVVSQRPESRRVYAEMIVRTLGFLSEESTPALASGIGTPNTVEGRLTQIMRGVATAGVSWWGKAILLVAVLIVLGQSPTLVRAQKDEKSPAETPAVPSTPTPPTVAAAVPIAPLPTAEIVTVMDEAGRPVSGIDVIAASMDERISTPLRTDARGQIRVPREWISTRGSYGSSCLIVRDGDARIGWLDLYRVASKRELDTPPAWVNQPLRIVLLPCTEAVTGVMTDPTDLPLPGIRVVATWIMHQANDGLGPGIARDEFFASSVTDQDGRYRINVPAQASVRIEPQHPDWQRHWFAATADQLSLGRRALIPAGRIEGRVVELATGLPRAGDKVMAVRVEDGKTRVDHQAINYGVGRTLRDGTFVMGSLPPGQYDVFYIGPQALSHPHGTLSDFAQHKIEVTSTKPAHVDFRLRPSIPIIGFVVDHGKPLANVEVATEGPGRPQSMRTGLDGKFQFGVLPGENRVYVPGRGPPRIDADPPDVKVQVPAEGNIDPILLRVDRAISLPHSTAAARSDRARRDKSIQLIVTVLDLEKRALAGLDVAAYVQGERIDPPRRTDERGQIRIPLEWYSTDSRTAACLMVRDGETRIGWLDLQPTAVMRNARPRPADADAPLQIVMLPRIQPVTGVLTDKDDRPLADIPVAITACYNPLGSGLLQLSLGADQIAVAMTDREGRFQLQFPMGLGGTIAPFHPDWLHHPIIVRSGVRDVGRHVITPGARVAGTVVDAVTGQPRAHEWVTARLQKPKQPSSRATHYGEAVGRAKTDDAGRFLIGGLIGGAFDIQYAGQHAKVAIGKVGSVSFTESMTAKAVEGVRLVPGTTARADFRVRPGLRLTGKVLDAATKKPLQQVVVGWFDAAHPQTAGHRTVQTDANGQFAIHVHPGICEVFVNELSSGSQPDARRKMLIAADKEVPEVVLIATVNEPVFGTEAEPKNVKQVRR